MRQAGSQEIVERGPRIQSGGREISNMLSIGTDSASSSVRSCQALDLHLHGTTQCSLSERNANLMLQEEGVESERRSRADELHVS